MKIKYKEYIFARTANLASLGILVNVGARILVGDKKIKVNGIRYDRVPEIAFFIRDGLIVRSDTRDASLAIDRANKRNGAKRSADEPGTIRGMKVEEAEDYEAHPIRERGKNRKNYALVEKASSNDVRKVQEEMREVRKIGKRPGHLREIDSVEDLGKALGAEVTPSGVKKK